MRDDPHRWDPGAVTFQRTFNFKNKNLNYARAAQDFKPALLYCSQLWNAIINFATVKLRNFLLWYPDWLLPAHADRYRGGVCPLQCCQDGGQPLRDDHPGAACRLPVRHQLLRPPLVGGHPQHAGYVATSQTVVWRSQVLIRHLRSAYGWLLSVGGCHLVWCSSRWPLGRSDRGIRITKTANRQ